MHPAPEISILMAAHGLRAEIATAVASVFACAEGAAVEVIIASDDGTDYRECLPADPRLVFAPIGPIASGAPAARNRALALARGDFITMLDADDGYEGTADGLAATLALARKAGAAVIPSIIRAPDGTAIRRVPPPGTASLGWCEWRQVFASLHLLRPRATAEPFRPFRLIDDVWWDLQGLAHAGGRAPVSAALAYRYQLRAGQLTETRAGAFDADYAEALAILHDNPDIFGTATHEVARILWRWRAMNRHAERAATGKPRMLGHYHRHVAAYLTRA
ncbi:MAG: glycosyltransferase [Roseomonas sp.]|nr:glycosyltransferase [Roseomonas sp.]MCA3288931.1 glycosyltransferase [Roseomonas sp.]MCA3294851.1 glycosyltransferase [Roseomonas sp.]